MTRSTRDILVAARARIADPEKWCQGEYAVLQDGKVISEPRDLANATDVAQCCALGAVHVEAGHDYYASFDTRMLLTGASNRLYGKNAHQVNDDDELGHDAVMKVFDLAIELAS